MWKVTYLKISFETEANCLSISRYVMDEPIPGLSHGHVYHLKRLLWRTSAFVFVTCLCKSNNAS